MQQATKNFETCGTGMTNLLLTNIGVNFLLNWRMAKLSPNWRQLFQTRSGHHHQKNCLRGRL